MGLEDGANHIRVEGREHLLEPRDVLVLDLRSLRRLLHPCKLLLLLLLLLLLNLVLLRQSRRIAASVKHLCPGHPRWSHTDWLVTVGPHLVGHGWWCRSEREDDVDVSLLPLPLFPRQGHPLFHRLSIEHVTGELEVGPRHSVIQSQVALIENLNVQAVYPTWYIAAEDFVPARVLRAVQVSGRLVDRVADADATVRVHPREPVVLRQLGLSNGNFESPEHCLIRALVSRWSSITHWYKVRLVPSRHKQPTEQDYHKEISILTCINEPHYAQ
jgi:hypothetical protein